MYSFCIITDGKDPEALQREIDSIMALNVPEYEFILCGDIPALHLEAPFIFIMRPDLAEAGNLGAMRNACVTSASGDIIVVTDDDMIFHDDFYTGMQGYGDNFDVLSCRILNPDGTRYWDWKAHDHATNKNWLVQYHQHHPKISLTGGLTIAKKWVFERVLWPDDLGFYQDEDVNFTDRLKAAKIRINFNAQSTVTHDAPYTQRGVGVFRFSELEAINAL